MTMTLAGYAFWALLLALQNASFTVVSRARNSGSDAYHAIASVFSNGIWLLVNFLVVSQFNEILKTNDMLLFAQIALFYVTFTVLGSVYGGKISRTFFEKGKRRVGYYENTKISGDLVVSGNVQAKGYYETPRAP